MHTHHPELTKLAGQIFTGLLDITTWSSIRQVVNSVGCFQSYLQRSRLSARVHYYKLATCGRANHLGIGNISCEVKQLLGWLPGWRICWGNRFVSVRSGSGAVEMALLMTPNGNGTAVQWIVQSSTTKIYRGLIKTGNECGSLPLSLVMCSGIFNDFEYWCVLLLRLGSLVLWALSLAFRSQTSHHQPGWPTHW